jgi:hypothetical protein
MYDRGPMALRSRSLLLGGVLAILLAAGFSSAALAKGQDLPLNVRIVGAAGEHDIKFVSSEELDRAAPFNDQVADMEKLATPLVFGSERPVSLPAPGLTDFYEIDFTQLLAAYRFPWRGMRSPQFYFYLAQGGTPAYVRLHVPRGSRPAVDGWLLARPGFTELITPYLSGLTTIHSEPQPPAQPVGWWWLGPVLVLVGASVLLLSQAGRYFIPVVAIPRTK